METLLLVLISYHQQGWTLALFISTKIHQLGWFTGSGIPLSHDWDWDQAVEGLAGTLGCAPPMQVGWYWGPSLGVSGGEFKGKGEEGWEHHLAMPCSGIHVVMGVGGDP